MDANDEVLRTLIALTCNATMVKHATSDDGAVESLLMSYHPTATYLPGARGSCMLLVTVMKTQLPGPRQQLRAVRQGAVK